LNESLCRALLRARLTEEDVAARLQVDPKTVRRWLEGRVPYLRHRWAIAAMLGVDETDLWPQLRTTRTRPDEVLAIYPHRDKVPRDVWLHLFSSAQHEIGILEDVDSPVAADRSIADALVEQARSGVRLRICLQIAEEAFAGQGSQGGRDLTARVRDAVAIYAPLREKGEVEVRLHQGAVYNSIYYADGQLLVSQRVYGAAVKSAPTLHLERVECSDMGATYSDAFEVAWAVGTAAG
jgi:transcriptional regulator with XRE-family HTH domain